MERTYRGQTRSGGEARTRNHECVESFRGYWQLPVLFLAILFALRWFERAIEAQPDHSGALNNLGVLFAQKGQYDDSVATFRYGLGKIPDDEPLHLNLARVYAMTGRRDDAVGVLNELLEKKPGSVAGRRFLEELMRR